MVGENGTMLRPGMVLLKNYVPFSYKIKIVKICWQLGLGPGGFYQPGDHDGAKVHLKMMCLGENWDTESWKYEDLQPFDGSKPPIIAAEFYYWVKKALADSIIRIISKVSSVENIFPGMSPKSNLQTKRPTGSPSCLLHSLPISF